MRCRERVRTPSGGIYIHAAGDEINVGSVILFHGVKLKVRRVVYKNIRAKYGWTDISQVALAKPEGEAWPGRIGNPQSANRHRDGLYFASRQWLEDNFRRRKLSLVGPGRIAAIQMATR